MNQNFHEEETLGKAYDSRLMKRLMTFAVPYWKNLLAAVLMLFVVTGAELARPYLIKVAVDDHITALTRPMRAFAPNEAPIEGTPFRGKVYIREERLQQSVDDNIPLYQILQKNRRFYLARGSRVDPNVDRFSIIEENGECFVMTEGVKYPAEVLSSENVGLFREEDNKSLVRLGIIFFLIALTGFVFNYAQVYIMHLTSQKIIHNMRRKIFTHLQSLSLSFFDRNPVGRLVTRVTNDTDTLNEMYSSVIVNLFRDIFMVCGVVIIMLRMNIRLALVSLSVLPLIILAAFIFRHFAREAYRRVRTALARINADMAENINGMRIVQIFNQEEKKYRQFRGINKQYLEASMDELRVFAVFRPVIDLLFSLAMALLIWYGGRAILAGKFSFGLVFSFTYYMGQFFHPIMELTEKYNILQAAMASAERIFQLLDTEPEIKEPPNPVVKKKFSGKIEFKNVWFAYHEEDWVLRDVSFTIKPGETVAFVGATGAGKTSIISLLSRLYDIQKGEILIDGVNIKDYSLATLRKNIGVVLQDVFLFTGDIKTNIRLNNREINEKRISEIARYVNADSFIRSLPKGYNEPVVERGATLSAGQRQLLAFARAIAFNPDILVLDEATANIDTETERLIQDALQRLIEGRTTIVVAHRLSTIQHADKIIVLHKGKIRESGKHQELLAKRGLYYDLYRLQYKDQLKEDEDTG